MIICTCTHIIHIKITLANIPNVFLSHYNNLFTIEFAKMKLFIKNMTEKEVTGECQSELKFSHSIDKCKLCLVGGLTVEFMGYFRI